MEFDRTLMDWHLSNETSKRLHYIPGVGPLLPNALVAGVADSGTFRPGRNCSALIGLVPKQLVEGARPPARTGNAGGRGGSNIQSASCPLL